MSTDTKQRLVRELAAHIRDLSPAERRRLPKRPPQWRLPRTIMREHERWIGRIVGEVRGAVSRELLEGLGAITARAREQRPDARTDDWNDELEGRIARVRAIVDGRLREENVDDEVLSFARRIAAFNLRQRNRVMSAAIGVSVSPDEPWIDAELASWARANADLITSLAGDYVDNVASMTRTAVMRGDSAADIRDAIRARYGVHRNRAAFIARDQIAKLNGDIMHRRQTDAGVDEYIWRTSADERVRDSHIDKNGRRFRWDSPPADTGHPGDDFQCRCYAEPVFDDVVAAAVEMAERMAA